MGGPVRDKLATERALADWRSLAPHHARGALFLVHNELDPLDAAEAVARDDTARVAEWLASGRLRKPSDDEAKAWGEAQGTAFEFLIVQPFVVARAVARADD